MSKSKHRPAQKIFFFYCKICKDYELKTSPHYRAQKQRFARRRKAEMKLRSQFTKSLKSHK